MHERLHQKAWRYKQKRTKPEPSTPQKRERKKKQQWTTIKRNRMVVFYDLPPGWKLGRRIYWRVLPNGSLKVSLSPKGMLNAGRYISSKLRRPTAKPRGLK